MQDGRAGKILAPMRFESGWREDKGSGIWETLSARNPTPWARKPLTAHPTRGVSWNPQARFYLQPLSLFMGKQMILHQLRGSQTLWLTSPTRDLFFQVALAWPGLVLWFCGFGSYRLAWSVVSWLWFVLEKKIKNWILSMTLTFFEEECLWMGSTTLDNSLYNSLGYHALFKYPSIMTRLQLVLSSSNYRLQLNYFRNTCRCD
jgi:hypothetical protein